MGAPLFDYPTLVAHACNIAFAAGQLINEFATAQGAAPVRIKKDLSPVTDADEAANGFIVQELAKLTHATPIIAEESIAFGETAPPSTNTFWLVDPLDGSKEFINGADEYTVNIALIVENTPKLGVVYLPALGTLYWGGPKIGAFRQENESAPKCIQTRKPPDKGATVIISRSHLTALTKDWLSGQNFAETIIAGSSLKFCRVAEGAADLYPRLGRTMDRRRRVRGIGNRREISTLDRQRPCYVHGGRMDVQI